MSRFATALLGLGLVVAACQPAAGGATSAPTAGTLVTPTATVAPTAAVTPGPTLPVAMSRPTDLPTDGHCEDENSSCLGVLVANTTYRTKVFKPTVTFSLPSGTWINGYDGEGDFGMESLDPAGDFVKFFRDPRATDKAVGAAIEDVAAWLETNEQLTVTPFEPVALGGLEGLVMDVTTAPGASGSSADCPVQVCVDYLRGDDPVLSDPYEWHWDWGTAGPEKVRLYLLRDGDRSMAVVVDSLDGTTFDSLIAIWDQIAATIKFG